MFTTKSQAGYCLGMRAYSLVQHGSSFFPSLISDHYTIGSTDTHIFIIRFFISKSNTQISPCPSSLHLLRGTLNSLRNISHIFFTRKELATRISGPMRLILLEGTVPYQYISAFTHWMGSQKLTQYRIWICLCPGILPKCGSCFWKMINFG